MSVVIVGGDRLGNIPENLSSVGYQCSKHITGRKCKNCKISCDVDVVLVLTDYVGHKLCESVKEQAKAKGVKAIFCRRSWASIYKNLQMCGLLN